jgi:hypothetical protein
MSRLKGNIFVSIVCAFREMHTLSVSIVEDDVEPQGEMVPTFGGNAKYIDDPSPTRVGGTATPIHAISHGELLATIVMRTTCHHAPP